MYTLYIRKVLYFGSNINKTLSLFPFNWCRMVPNLAISNILSRENNKIRNLQVQTSVFALTINGEISKSKVIVSMFVSYVQILLLDARVYYMWYFRCVLYFTCVKHLNKRVAFSRLKAILIHSVEQLRNHHTLLKYNVE